MKTFKEVRAPRPPKIKKGLGDKKGKIQKVDMDTSGKKLSFKVTDEFGSFQTVGVKKLATMFENYRTLARKGMGTETKKDARVGLELDFYETERGDKVFGKITKVTGTGYTVQAMERGNNKKYTFKFHDRVKAKKLLEQ